MLTQFGQTAIHFGAVSLVQQNGAKDSLKLQAQKPVSPNTDPHANWESHDVVSFSNKKTLAHVSQAPGAQTDVKMFNGKGGLVAIVTTNNLRFLAYEGSHLHLPDTDVDIAGTPITGSSLTNDATSAQKTPVQNVTKQALILAGGFATRLEPFSGPTNALPKPALPLVGNRSIIVDIAKNLYDSGIRHIVGGTCYMPEPIRDQLNAFNDQLKQAGKEPLKFTFMQEEQPVGTAGGLVEALKNGVVDKTRPILVVQGDAVTSLDFSTLLNEHAKHDAKVTIACKQVNDSDLKSFGFAVTDQAGDANPSGHVRHFVEKPATEAEVAKLNGSRLANTGIYVLSPKSYKEFEELGNELLDKGKTYDYAQNFLTPLGAQKNSIWAEKATGFWADAGSPSSYMATIKDIANGKMGPKMAKEARQMVDNQGVIYWPSTREKVEQLKAQNQQQGSPFELKGNIVVANASDKN